MFGRTGAPQKGGLTEAQKRLYNTTVHQVTAWLNAAAARCYRHWEVWPRSDTARRTSPARRPRPGVLQAGSVSSSVSERPRTTVPVGLLRPGRQCCHSAASAFRQPSTTCSTSLSSQYLRPLCPFSRRPHSLELSPGFHPGPDLISSRTRPSVQSVSDVCLKRTRSLSFARYYIYIYLYSHKV